MEIKDARKALAELERQITKAVQSFESESDCFVNSFHIDKIENLKGDKPTTWIRISADLTPDRNQ